MSEIIGFVGMSHSPFVTMLPPSSPSGPGGAFLGDAARVAAAVADLSPDAIVVIGPDHFHANFYDVMPPFVLGVEAAEGFGDFGSASGPLPVASSLAWSIHEGLAAADFDISLSYALTVDHGIVQSYKMVSHEDGNEGGIPLVPLIVNTAAPPLPSMERCVALGRALGEAIRGSDFDGRVLVVASGGLSHWLPPNDPRDVAVAGEKREALIHGRRDPRAFAAAREPRVRAMGGDPTARVNADWDSWFLGQLAVGDLDSVTALGHERLEEHAGSGGHEIRCWLAGHAAVGEPLVWSSYEPVPEWITGMAIGTTFEVV
ncbi:3-carboxyethylcatechol 2,3-dioxygenase [Streptomyces sp. L-9-10]|uniref:DODA-type extradiol aromatic ring-opening family dioxygenase n=1 Tax=Streptomyces sp. L-9-10 TaxID=1478131 RepID=UPI00101E0E46|nr:2,3-dihydroxyphenylpropionate 1,2-dioxygenase [Streptomyces sp. L-9-10]RYJ29240.1 3-carboxyethylcatechol 2,3-dioxygenase [Streptomyces sp. L-9-10]